MQGRNNRKSAGNKYGKFSSSRGLPYADASTTQASKHCCMESPGRAC